MIELNKESLQSFLKNYHALHDSYISKIEYDIKKNEIVVLVDVFWSGEPKLKADGSYETNKTKVRILFEKIEDFKTGKIDSWEYIYEVSFKIVEIKNKDFICFATEEENPSVCIIAESAKFEEVK